MGLQKPVRLKKSTPVKSPSFTAAVIIFMVVIGVVAGAMLIAARAPAPKTSASKAPSANAAPATKPGADTTPANGLAESAANAPAPPPAAVTMTGCLERHDETFRLKDTTGVDAPKSRSWKSGFLKKGPASIDVVDAAHKLKLTDHVGQRVTVTGVLVDREMQARSLRRLAPSCN
jgi:hypothetical protein